MRIESRVEGAVKAEVRIQLVGRLIAQQRFTNDPAAVTWRGLGIGDERIF
jgi:hypothetical protein